MAVAPRTKIDISTGTFMRAAVVVLGIIFLYLIRDIVMIVLVAIVIAASVEPLIRWLMKYHIPRVLAVLSIYIVGIGGFITVFYLMIPPLLSDFQTFFVQFPTLLESSLIRSKDYLGGIVNLDTAIVQLREVASNADFYVREALSGFFGATSSLFTGIISFVFTFIISFYLAVQQDGVANVLRIVTPKEDEEYVLSLWDRSQKKIGRWLQGQLLLGVIVGVIVFIALTILGVKYAFILAVLSALFELIPYFGPIMAALPAIAVAAIQDPFLGLLVAGLFVVVQQMENHLIYPQVVRKTVGVPPLLAIIALLIGGSLAGMMGFIVSIPVAVVLVEYLNDIVDRKKTI